VTIFDAPWALAPHPDFVELHIRSLLKFCPSNIELRSERNLILVVVTDNLTGAKKIVRLAEVSKNEEGYAGVSSVGTNDHRLDLAQGVDIKSSDASRLD
jgi:hypothetical protein